MAPVASCRRRIFTWSSRRGPFDTDYLLRGFVHISPVWDGAWTSPFPDSSLEGEGFEPLSFRVSWRGRSVAIRIAGDTVQATLVEGEGMEMRIAAETRKLAPGVTLQVSV